MREGFAEKVPEAEVNVTSDRVYYMPHHAVFRPDSSTTKTCVVFDASAKAPDCQSLNDALATGPHLKPDLLKTVLNFRCREIALTADIEKASLQTVVKQENQDASVSYGTRIRHQKTQKVQKLKCGARRTFHLALQAAPLC